MKSGYQCPYKYINVTRYIEDKINKGQRREVFSTFGYDGDLEDGEFYYFLGDVVAGEVQYGTRVKFCEELAKAPNDTEQLMHWLADYASKTGLSLEEYAAGFVANTTIDYNKNMRQWTYQTCSDLGYFQTPARNSKFLILT